MKRKIIYEMYTKMLFSSMRGRINYRDLIINRNDNSIAIETFKKPTSIDTTMHFASNHPMEHKMAAYEYLINRVNILSIRESNKQQEMNNILSMAKNNGFPLRLIQRLKDKITYKRKKILKINAAKVMLFSFSNVNTNCRIIATDKGIV
jgi:hypothetical protein